MRVAALVENETIVNCIVLGNEDVSLLPGLFGVDDAFDVATVDPTPSIGWSLIDGVWTMPRPYPSWTLDANRVWQPPTPIPADGGMYVWDEATLSWVSAI